MTTNQPPGPPSPPALRLRRPGWRDPRLLLGVLLVAAAVALGSTAVSAAGRTVGVYVAVGTLTPGDPVVRSALRVEQVHLPEGAEHYLLADAPPPEGLVALRTVAAGELVPRAAVAAAGDLEVRPVAVTPRGALPAALTAGARVDLWFVPDPADGDRAPYELAAGLTVAEVSQPRSALGAGGGTTVHVLVPVVDLAEVLAALAARGAVEVVHVPGAG